MSAGLGFLHVFQPGEDPVAPPLLLLHGTGGNEFDLLPLGQSISPGSALLSPRGKVLENDMPRFFRRIAEGVFDLEDLRFRTEELAGFIERASAAYGVNAGEFIAVGYSNGANIAASLLLARPGLIGGAILLRAMSPFIPETTPDLRGTSVLLANGALDPIIPLASARLLGQTLADAGAQVTAQERASAGHSLTLEDIAAARDWLAQPASRVTIKRNGGSR